MKLLTVGDSFTYGEELVDKQMAWPFRLADKLNCEVTNLAKPGGGNSRMVRYVIENVNSFDLVIIAWSHFARIELADENGFYDLWPGRRSRFRGWRGRSWRGRVVAHEAGDAVSEAGTAAEAVCSGAEFCGGAARTLMRAASRETCSRKSARMTLSAARMA